MVDCGSGFYYLGLQSAILKWQFGTYAYIGPNGPFWGYWRPLGLFINGLLQFDHPYIFNLHGSVLFAGIAGKKKKKAVEVGTLEREV